MANDTHGSSVLIVDDDPQNLRLMAAVLERGGLEPRPVTSGRLAIEAAVADPPDLILLDVTMPDMSGTDVCLWLKNDERLRSIPVIFISGLQGIEDKIEAFRVGAIDYISKPFQDQEMFARVKTHLELRRQQVELVSNAVDLKRQIADQVRVVTASQLATIFALAKLAEIRDDDTGLHVERVRTFSRMLAVQLRELRVHEEQLTTEYIDNVFQTAGLHDIGKVGIRDAILLKPGKLTADELVEMQKHAAIGADTLADVLKHYPGTPFLRMGEQVARSHHEKWNGSGYPAGLKGELIPLVGRIVALADVYDALSSKRCYHAARSHEDARQMILEGKGSHFDPDVVAAFCSLDSEFQRVQREMQNP